MTGPTTRPRPVFRLSLLALASAFLLHLAMGARHLPLPAIWQALTAYDPTNFEHRILWDLRLPRAIYAALAGSALAVG
ncbi:MAG: iron chelate uptake ABC transporter family permease subunit [Pseudomonadota bacterium]